MKIFRKICVLMGGVSNEREVSLISGKNVADALESLEKYEIQRVVLDSESVDSVPECDACFLALHGGWGENGGVQAALDARKIPYTGPGAACSRLSMDKIATKRLLDSAGIASAPWFVTSDGNQLPPPEIGFPCVVKAPRDGSSVGVYLVKDAAAYPKAVADAVAIDGREALVEKFIAGREMTVGLLDGEALPPIEIIAAGGWYGYEEKYNSEETRYPFPHDQFVPELKRVALDAWRVCGCRGVTRVDFRVDETGKPYVLELNTLPGMTGHSLVPKAAAEIGLSFAQLCDRILSAATYN